MEPFNQELLKNPHWTLRNKKIAENLEPNKTILDLGCGAKDLLKYYQSTKYLGVDIIPGSDLCIDLNNDFHIEGEWNYVISSGILEYLDNPEKFIKKIKFLGNKFIFTWYQGEGFGRPSNEIIRNIIKEDYIIQKEINWGSQKIFICYNQLNLFPFFESQI
jgi:SAM-dependent methyltransferase